MNGFNSLVRPAEHRRSLRCVECGAQCGELFHVYSPTVLKLLDCDRCHRIRDKYVEQDNVIILIDLLVQKFQAYVHVLHNSNYVNFWRLGMVFVICDAYYKWVSLRGLDTETMQIYELEWRFYACFLQSLIGVFTFICTVLALLRVFCATSGDFSVVDLGRVSAALLGSFYGSVWNLCAVIWGQSSIDSSYAYLILLFLFVSHQQTVRALLLLPLFSAASLVAVGMVVQYLSEYAFAILLYEHLQLNLFGLDSAKNSSVPSA